jgi:hypothetical protein
MKRTIIIFCLLFSVHAFSQEFRCSNPDITEAFRLAVRTVDINTRRGILAAGGDYGGEWTRDIAINSWNGVSLLRPEVAERSLWSVTKNRDTIGHQYWDKIIWIPAALNHYLATGDKDFLRSAYKCSANTMKELELSAFDTKYGLFTGPSVFNDGIAGYQPPVYDSLVNSSFVLDHPGSKNIKCLSTNCIYLGAYNSLREMNRILRGSEEKEKEYGRKADILKSNILKYLYDSKTKKLSYLIDCNGNPDNSQEGLGLAFAAIFGVIDKDADNEIISTAHVSKYGITSIYPDFKRYSPEKPGRHNNIIWPVVNGFFASAALQTGCYTVFANELESLTRLALDEDKGNYNFREIYNPYSGKPDGGWQVGQHWPSCSNQTWSATAYIRIVLGGLMGIELGDESVDFAPYIPDGLSYLELTALQYRGSVLDITIKGSGRKIKSFLTDGKSQNNYRFISHGQGTHKIEIVME